MQPFETLFHQIIQIMFQKLINSTFLLVVIILFAFLILQKTFAQHIDFNDLGNAKKIAYIDVLKLKSITPQSTTQYPIRLSLNEKNHEEPPSFYLNVGINNTSCEGGSPLRPNVIHYCLPYADLGYHISPQSLLDGEFISMHGYGLNIYYETDKNRYYFYGCCWNAGGFGPFEGNPKTELPKAIKPRREKDLELNIESKISQFWLHPKADEEKEITDVGPVCSMSYCPPTPRESQLARLNTLIIKFQLKNNSKHDLFIYQENGRYVRYESILSRHIENKDFYRQSLETNPEPNNSSAWKSFPRGSVMEFDIKMGGHEKMKQAILLYFNDKPTYWDSEEYMIKFTAKYRKFKNHK
ncbi:MAG: hypothetical protein MUC29_02135 [Pyrinomonadaceae bacterium]|jgi:hypothetical protein|nr:hypothetical protein [Pyrinomonadaceae bacterium]